MKLDLSILTLVTLVAATPLSSAQTKAPEAPKEAPKEAPAAPAKDADYSKAILGAWRQEIKDGGAVGYGITTYNADGKATSVLKVDAQGQKIEITVKAKWTLDKDKLNIEITESSTPEMIPVGTKITETILSLTEKEFRYKEEPSGKEITETRVKEEEKKPAAGGDEKPGKK